MPPFGLVLDEYLATLSPAKASHEADLYLARHLRPFFGDIRIGLISKDTVERYKAHRRMEILALPKNAARNPKEVSLASVNRELTLLGVILTRSVESGLIRANPVHAKLFFAENDKAMRVLERGEVRRLIAACKGHIRDIVIFALHTGMRKGEILSMKWAYVKMEDGLICFGGNTKNGRKRVIPMSPTIRLMMRELRKRRGDSEYVFTYRHGGRMFDVKTGFKSAVRRAGLGHVRFHDLRHTCACHLLDKGVNIVDIKEWLGHSDLHMTMRYLSARPNKLRSAAAAIDYEGNEAARFTTPDQPQPTSSSMVYAF